MRILTSVCMMVILACESRPTAAPTPAAEPPADEQEALRQELMQADRDFAAATEARGVEGWVEYFAPEGAQVRPDGDVVGHAAIREFMTPLFADTSRALVWEPVRAEVASSGDLGYTIGTFRLVAQDTTRGERGVLGRGRYLTVWRRQPDGSWKVEADIGTSE